MSGKYLLKFWMGKYYTCNIHVHVEEDHNMLTWRRISRECAVERGGTLSSYSDCHEMFRHMTLTREEGREGGREGEREGGREGGREGEDVGGRE